MLPSLQPSRPKPPQQPAPPMYGQQQRRAVHEATHQNQPRVTLANTSAGAPRNQIEAMPPFPPAQAPPQFFYDSAIRHPVFFTQNLKKPPFPIPQIASQGWSPVANGYVMEQQRTLNKDPKTKL
ncbi:hypothetical protein DE146DRAFT_66367 [Phaeosphaeria sp. MPI-PUGE-AT-0046c]|nr:hypothetical protein DE146DRAFT_66367 [Phaeosphaeria sp. MPI-PUGE-AT-0046c]